MNEKIVFLYFIKKNCPKTVCLGLILYSLQKLHESKMSVFFYINIKNVLVSK